MTIRTEPHAGMQTPGGKAQHCDKIAEGVHFLSCAGHGGYKLSAARNKLVHSAWRRKGGWYEEDCDYAIVVLTFPEHFKVSTREHAVCSAKNYSPDEYEAVFGVKVGLSESYKLRLRKFEKDTEGKLVVHAAYGTWHEKVPEGMVGVFVQRQGASETGYFLIPAEEYNARKGAFVIEDPSKYQRVDRL